MRLVDFHRTGSIATAAGIAMLLGLTAAAWAAPTDGSHQQPTAQPAAAVPTWPANPQTIAQPTASAEASSSGFDWGAAGIGAGSMAVIVGVALGGNGVVVRRRRKPQSASFAP